MNKLMGLSGMRSLEQFKSLSGSGSGPPKTFPISQRPSSDSVSSGSFANLKLTAEKLVKEQASAKTDLEMANSKLKKLTEHIHVLEDKLQNAFNENAKLKVKQKEDERLWKGLESKFSSTKTLCDQLTETLQHLAGQVQNAEKDKEFFENKFSATSVALDSFNDQMKSLSLRLESSEETIRNRKEELKQLGIEKEEKEKLFRDEQFRVANIIEEKDITIKNFEASVAASGLAVDNLNSKLAELHLELRLKEDGLKDLRNSIVNLEIEKSDILCSNKQFTNKLDMALRDIKDLEDLINMLATKFTELDNQSLTFSDKVVQLNALFDYCFKLVQEERDLATQHAHQRYDQLHERFVHTTSEKDALQLVNQNLNNKVVELQKEQEFAMVQNAEECRLAEERIRRLESEAETLHLKKTEMEKLITTLEEKINTLSETSRLSEEKKQELLLKVSELETEKEDNTGKLQVEIHQKKEEIDMLRKEIGKHEEHLDSLVKQVNQLQNMLEEKEQLVLQYEDRGKQLEDKKEEIQGLLADAESKLTDAKKQYDQMLESKQLELSRHLKEISQRNDQAINDIRRKYEVEKLESVNLEKEKANKAIGEIERKCDQKLAECKEDSRQYVISIQEEHATLITRIKQEHDKKELSLVSNHKEELNRVQLQAENELKEKTSSLKNEHEAQLRAMRCHHEDECRKLQEELNIQKSKEERQRALLQLQWKVMSDKPQEEQEVDSKKSYYNTSTKSGGDKRGQHPLVRAEDEEKDLHYKRATQTPVSNMLNRTEKMNPGSVMSIPKHSRKVTHREYEVETANGRTITKRKKTKSTVMFADPKNKRRQTPKANTPRDIAKGIKGGGHAKPSNIGDLFSEGSLNPYADDPYAFD
ncbi:hypothetical protein LguiB_006739 [Lonicera macranthoides]